MFLVDDQILLRAQQCLYELVGRREIIKASDRDRVLYSWVMGVKSDEIGDTHVHQFLDRIGAVERFPSVSFMLPAFIEKRHDHVDPVSLAVDRGNDSFQVLVMVIGRHMIDIAVHFIGNTVITDIH